MPVTISDVAKRAGVARSTVSLALNGRPGVTQEKRDAVMRAAAELAYSPHHQSRDTSASPCTLLVICQRFPGRRLDDIGFVYSSYIAGIKQTSNIHGCDLAVLPVSTEAVEHSHAPSAIMLDTVQADGVLILGLRSVDDPLLSLVKQLNVPFMAMGRHQPTANFNCIGIDDRQALAAVVERLVALGHSNIAFVGEQLTRTTMWHQQRLAGFHEGLQQCGLPHLSDRVSFAPDPEVGVTETLARWPDTTAIIGLHDNWAEGIIRALAGRGIAVSRDVSVVGYDNINGLDTKGQNSLHQITSVDSRQLDAGRIGTELLLSCIKRKEIQFMQVALQWRLVERGSLARVSRLSARS